MASENHVVGFADTSRPVWKTCCWTPCFTDTSRSVWENMLLDFVIDTSWPFRGFWDNWISRYWYLTARLGNMLLEFALLGPHGPFGKHAVGFCFRYLVALSGLLGKVLEPERPK